MLGGVVGRLFGTDKAIDNLMDKDSGLLAKAGGWVGGLSYTAEEKAEADSKTREWGLRQLEALAPFKVVQRILAFAVAAFWIFVGLNVVAAIWIEAITREQVIFNGQMVWSSINAATPLLDFAMSNYVFWPAIAVLGLYFTGGVLPHEGKS
jgi:sulfite exporter TauE/SafE